MLNKSEQRIKVKVVNMDANGHLECSHITSRLKYGAVCPKQFTVDIGQIVTIEYRGNSLRLGKQGADIANYVVVDTLMTEVTATVLKVQHLISNDKLYTSVILENNETKKRIHSLIDNTNRLFSDSTSTLIEGDIVKVYINNGEIFKILGV